VHHNIFYEISIAASVGCFLEEFVVLCSSLY
jgi:hypothetical protein